MIAKFTTDYRKGEAVKKYLLCANAIRDGELSATSSGRTLGKVSVKAEEKQDGTAVFMTVTVWGDNARLVGGIRKGDMLLACSEVREREYSGKTYYDFNADFITVMGVNAAAASAPPPVFPASTDDGVNIPFSGLDDSDGELPF